MSGTELKGLTVHCLFFMVGLLIGIYGNDHASAIFTQCATTGTAKLGDYSITCAVERKP